MLKLTKLRTIANLPSTRGIEEEELTEILKKQTEKLTQKAALNSRWY